MLAVDIANLHYSYPDGTPALDGVELRLPEGDRLALIGVNGAGKSTLLLHLNGLLQGQGRVEIFGQPVTPRNLRAIREQTGLVFQNPDDQLFMPSVFDEVAYAAINARYERAEVRRRVAEALSATGLTGLEAKHPTNLSLGQKKRVAIASVLVTDNRLLVLDEPSAGLDPPTRAGLLSLLQSLPATMIVATHDLEFAQALCTRAALMQRGHITRFEAVNALISDPGLFDA